MGRPIGAQNKDKPFRDALRLVMAERDRWRKTAEALADRAEKGDVAAIREVADRTDGKVASVLVGDNEHDPISVQEVTNEDRARAVAMLVKKVRNRGK